MGESIAGYDDRNYFDSPDAPGSGSSPDPYGAETGDEYYDDYPDTAGAGVPGASLINYLPAAVTAARGGFTNAGDRSVTVGPRGSIMTYRSSDDAVRGRNPIPVRGRGRGDASTFDAGDLLDAASDAAGFRITRKLIVYMIRKWGIPAVMQLTRLAADALLFLWAKRPRGRSRNPKIRTVLKRIREGERYAALMGHFAHRVRGRARRPHPFKKRRK